MNVPLYGARLSYDPLRDFVPVTRLSGGVSAVVVNPSLPVTDLQGLIAYAKAHPGQLNYGSGGAGTTTHLAAEMLKHMAGLDIVHVPFRAPTAATVALSAGQVQVIAPFFQRFTDGVAVLAQRTDIKHGRSPWE